MSTHDESAVDEGTAQGAPWALIPARKAGIRVPDDPYRYEPGAYPHWHMLLDCARRCGDGGPRPMAARILLARRLATLAPERVRSILGRCDSLIRSGLVTC
jgi:hypothetical protein